MSELSASVVTEVVEACRKGAAEAAAAFARTLDVQVTPTVGEPSTLSSESLSTIVEGPGLAIVFTCGKAAALLLIPESTGCVPPWCREPDATGQSKLNTLAQELGMLLLPEQYMPEDFKAGFVRSLTGALARGAPAEATAQVPLDLIQAGESRGRAVLVWPVSKPASVMGAAAAPLPKPQPAPPPAKPASPPARPDTSKRPRALAPAAPAGPRRPPRLEELPLYSRSLLRVRVPVIVTLAQKKQPLGRIVELGPGSIIQFDKSCEEMLELDVAGRPIALGEAVKVGDKFGLRVTSMILPDERFKRVDGGKSAPRDPARS